MPGLVGESVLSFAAGGLLMFALHATVLLLAAWVLERLGLLKHPGWAEWAWRVALFGAFVSMALGALPWRMLSTAPAPDLSPVRAMPAVVAAAPTTVALPTPDPAPSATKRTATPARTGVTADGPAAPASPPASPSRPDRAAVALPLAADAIALGLALWLSGTVLLLARMLVQALGLLRLRRRLVREGRPAGDALARATRALAVEMHVAMPVLRVLPGLSSPLVLPGAVLLPRWAEGLDAAQQRAMLAHELAHLRRRDPLWRPLQRLALVPLFFHPLAWHALRRLETLAETLCDAAAVQRSGSGRPLAECLAECLARSTAGHAHDDDRDGSDPHHTDRRGAGWALAMAEHSGGIVDRVRTLLETTPMTLSTIPAPLRWTAAALAVLLLLALPGVVVIARPGLVAGVLDHHSLSVVQRKDGQTITMRADMPVPGERLRIVSDGDVAFDARDSDIVRMGAGARFEIQQTRAGVTRALVVTPAGGGLRRAYRVDGVAHAYDADARAWLAATLPDMFRLTGLQADLRAKRLLAGGGVPALLAEIALLKDDHVRAEYIAQLFAQARPDAVQITQALAHVRAIGSDYEKRRTLQLALRQPALDAGHQATLLSIAAGIDSDFERAEWLVAAAPRLPVDGANQVPWMRALQAFGSDFERKRALLALIEDGTPRARAMAWSLQATGGMGSDFERRSVLEAVAGAGVPVPDAAYLAAVDAMGSDFERREALLSLIDAGRPGLARSRGVLRSARAMGSDFERGEVLKTLAASMPGDAALIEEYRAVARAMGDFERGQAEKALDRFYRG